MEKPSALTPSDVIALFTLTPTCQHPAIAQAFALFRIALLDKKIKESHDAFRELLKIAYEAIRDLKNDNPLYAIYVEIVNTASPVNELLRNKWLAFPASEHAAKIIPVDFTPKSQPDMPQKGTTAP